MGSPSKGEREKEESFFPVHRKEAPLRTPLTFILSSRTAKHRPYKLTAHFAILRYWLGVTPTVARNWRRKYLLST